jgi:hypothetical protein
LFLFFKSIFIDGQSYGKEPKKKAWKPKSFFPLAGRKEARGKEPVLNDILILAKHIFEVRATSG